MCSSSSISFKLRPSPQRLSKFSSKPKLNRSPWEKKLRNRLLRGEEMKTMNRKLQLKNKWIMEENMKLRRRALLLTQENHSLLSSLDHINKKSDGVIL